MIEIKRQIQKRLKIQADEITHINRIIHLIYNGRASSVAFSKEMIDNSPEAVVNIVCNSARRR